MWRGKPEHFPAITRIALESWFDLKNISDEMLKGIKEHYKKLHEKFKSEEDLNQSKWAVTRVEDKRYEKLPYDGVLLYSGQIASLRQEISKDKEEISPILDELEEARKILYRKIGCPEIECPPIPYFAVLVADGDKMGALLDQTPDFKEHRKISKKLAEFAKAAKTIVEKGQVYLNQTKIGSNQDKTCLDKDGAYSNQDELSSDESKSYSNQGKVRDDKTESCSNQDKAYIDQNKEHRGAAVYTGGDDVLALLPVHKALECAKELADEFKKKLEGKVTLSVGLGIMPISTPFTQHRRRHVAYACADAQQRDFSEDIKIGFVA
jgi:CRISPR-associated protein Cas10/Cmr2 subtype III-B